MDNTLDSLMDADFSITQNEWKSILFQVIMALIYIKKLDFTHNDLHTNNIMYIETEKSIYITNIMVVLLKFLLMVNYIK